jgi:hypothetical protein
MMSEAQFMVGHEMFTLRVTNEGSAGAWCAMVLNYSGVGVDVLIEAEPIGKTINQVSSVTLAGRKHNLRLTRKFTIFGEVTWTASIESNYPYGAPYLSVTATA